MFWLIIFVVIILAVAFAAKGSSGKTTRRLRSLDQERRSLDQAADWVKRFELWNAEFKQLNEEQTSKFQECLNESKLFNDRQSKQRQSLRDGPEILGEQQSKHLARWAEEYDDIFEQQNAEFDQWMKDFDQLDEVQNGQLNVWMERNEMLIDGSAELNEQQGNEIKEWLRESMQVRRQRMREFEEWANKSKETREEQEREFKRGMKRALAIDNKSFHITHILADVLSIDRPVNFREAIEPRKDNIKAEYEAGGREAICRYCQAVLSDRQASEGWPKNFAVAYVRESKLLLVQSDFPSFDFLSEPEWLSERTIDLEALYSSMIAQATLGVVHVLFSADYAGQVESIVFNGYVAGVDRATGHSVHPCVVTLHVNRCVFVELDLARVDPEACLNALDASISKDPSQLIAVEPLLDFKVAAHAGGNAEHGLKGLMIHGNVLDLNPRLGHEPK